MYQKLFFLLDINEKDINNLIKKYYPIWKDKYNHKNNMQLTPDNIYAFATLLHFLLSPMPD